MQTFHMKPAARLFVLAGTEVARATFFLIQEGIVALLDFLVFLKLRFQLFA